MHVQLVSSILPTEYRCLGMPPPPSHSDHLIYYMSNGKEPGVVQVCLGDIGGWTTQLYTDYNKPYYHYTDPY